MTATTFARKPWYIEGYTLEQEEASIKNAVDAGCTIVTGDSRTLLLDLDEPGSMELLEKRIDKINHILPHIGMQKTYFKWKSWSGHDHVKVVCAVDLTVGERLLLEVLLGSDRNRAAYGLARLHAPNQKDLEGVSKLFRPPGAVVELVNLEKLFETGVEYGPDVPF